MVSLGKGSSLRRVAMDDYDICLPGNQLFKAAALGERPQGHNSCETADPVTPC